MRRNGRFIRHPHAPNLTYDTLSGKSGVTGNPYHESILLSSKAPEKKKVKLESPKAQAEGLEWERTNSPQHGRVMRADVNDKWRNEQLKISEYLQDSGIHSARQVHSETFGRDFIQVNQAEADKLAKLLGHSTEPSASLEGGYKVSEQPRPVQVRPKARGSALGM